MSLLESAFTASRPSHNRTIEARFHYRSLRSDIRDHTAHSSDVHDKARGVCITRIVLIIAAAPFHVYVFFRLTITNRSSILAGNVLHDGPDDEAPNLMLTRDQLVENTQCFQ